MLEPLREAFPGIPVDVLLPAGGEPVVSPVPDGAQGYTYVW